MKEAGGGRTEENQMTTHIIHIPNYRKFIYISEIPALVIYLQHASSVAVFNRLRFYLCFVSIHIESKYVMRREACRRREGEKESERQPIIRLNFTPEHFAYRKMRESIVSSQ